MKTDSGQSMFEVLLALFIITLIVVAVVILSPISISNSLFSKNKTLSSKYTQEAVEWLRSQKESDINLFLTNSTDTYCLDQLNFTNQGLCAELEIIPNSIFTRQMVFTNSGNIVSVVVTTSWTDSKGIHQVSTSTDFTDRREQ